MKVLLINTLDVTGGAGIASLRVVAEMQRRYHIRFLSLVARKRSNYEWVEAVPTGPRTFLRHNLPHFINRTLGLQYRYLPNERDFILDRARALAPDVIHLHNIHGGAVGFFPTELIAELSSIAPIAWTLHDMWALTGHCAYPLACTRWETGCGRCPTLDIYPEISIDRTAFNWKRKQRVYERSDITVVAPSQWLADLAKSSASFQDKRVEHIFNGIDLNVFRPGPATPARARLGIPEDAKVIMFAAERVENNPRKGAPQLLEMIGMLDRESPWETHVLMVGGGKADLPDLGRVHVHGTGYIKSDHELVDFYRAADLLLFPSLQDNLPNILVEAQACGLPCAAFDVGGCGEAVLDGITGILAPRGDCRALVDGVLALLGMPDQLRAFSVAARKHAQENFSAIQAAERYYHLYQDLATGRQATPPRSGSARPAPVTPLNQIKDRSP